MIMDAYDVLAADELLLDDFIHDSVLEKLLGGPAITDDLAPPGEFASWADYHAAMERDLWRWEQEEWRHLHPGVTTYDVLSADDIL